MISTSMACVRHRWSNNTRISLPTIAKSLYILKQILATRRKIGLQTMSFVLSKLNNDRALSASVETSAPIDANEAPGDKSGSSMVSKARDGVISIDRKLVTMPTKADGINNGRSNSSSSSSIMSLMSCKTNNNVLHNEPPALSPTKTNRSGLNPICRTTL